MLWEDLVAFTDHRKSAPYRDTPTRAIVDNVRSENSDIR